MSKNDTTQTIGERVDELRCRIKSIAGSIPGMRDKLAAAVARGDERQRGHLREQIANAERDEAEIGAAVDHLVAEQKRQAEAEEAERQAERERQRLALIDRRHALAVEIDRTLAKLGRQATDLQAVTRDIVRLNSGPGRPTEGGNRYAVRNALWHHAREFCRLLQLPAPLGHFTDKRRPLAASFPPAKRHDKEEAA
jgi:hypothetical protein